MSDIENSNNNIEEDDESSETTEEDVFSCPICEGDVNHLIHRGYGWVKCPRCDKGIRKIDIPKKHHHLIKKVDDYKSKDKKKEDDYIPPFESEEDEIDSEKIPFDRPQEHWQVLESILQSFGVNDRAKQLIVARARRNKQPVHPSEVQRLLGAFKSGLKKDELSYVSEEYYLALESERNKRKELTSSRAQYYPRYDDDEEEKYGGLYSSKSSRTAQDEEYTPAWDRGKRGMVSVQEVKRMMEDQKKDNQIRDMNKELQELHSMVGQLVNQPPPSNGKDDFLTMIMDQQERSDKERQRSHEAQLATAQRSHEERMESMKREQDSRNSYSERLLEITRDANKQPIRADTDGFKEDGPRVLAQAITSAAEVVREGKPVHQLIEGAQTIQKASQPSEPVEIDRLPDDSKLGILSEIDTDLIDED